MAAVIQTLSSNVVILGLTMITGVLTARFLGPVGRGEQAAMGIWPQLFAYGLSLGMPEAVIYKIRREPAEAPQFVFAAIVVAALAGGTAMLAGVIALPSWLGKYSPETVSYAQWAMISTPLCSMFFAANAAIQAVGRFRVYNGLLIFMPALTLLLILGLLLVGRFTPQNTTTAYIVPIVPGFIIALVFVRRIYHPTVALRKESLRSLTSYGLRVWGADMLKLLSRQSDRAILVGLLSPANLGIYVVAQSVASVLSLVQNSVAVVLFPKATGLRPEAAAALANLAIRVSVALVGSSALVVCLIAPELIKFVYGGGFLHAVLPCRILLLEAVLAVVNLLGLQVFMALGRPGAVGIFQSVGVVAFVPLAFFLVPEYGLTGAALAWLGSSAARLVTLYVCFPIVLGITPPWPLIKWSDVVEVRARLLRV